MKKIECIIRSEKLKDLTDALRKISIGGMTVSEARGFGTQTQRPEGFLFVHKTKIEIYATDAQTKRIIPTILMYCSANKIGDGKRAEENLEKAKKITERFSEVQKLLH